MESSNEAVARCGDRSYDMHVLEYLHRNVKIIAMPMAMVVGALFCRPITAVETLTGQMITPTLIFLMLFFTFCRVKPSQMKPSMLHFWLLLFQTVACVAVYFALLPLNGVVAQGAMICVLAPVAMAAVVIAGMLGADVATMATYSLLCNMVIALFAPVVLTFTGCNCFKKMAKNSDDVSLTCAPEVLVLNNGVVAADITAQFPVKYFNPKAIVKVTPVMVFEGGEVAGTPKFFQGSKVKENYTVVDKKTGGVFTMHVEFPYDERMQISELQLRVEAKCPGSDEFTLVNANTGKVVKAKELEANPAIVRECGLVVAEGVNTLQQDLAYADAMAALPSDYKRVTTSVDKTEILYAINKANVTKKALKDADLEAFQANVDENLKNDRATQHVAVKGYASPDGPVKFNDTLSKERSESGDKVLAKLLKNSGLDIDVAAYGEDWEGFKELVSKSNIKDKDLILQVLSMYSSSTQREDEIKNMSSVFNELKKDILPQLRRSVIVNTIDLEGKTDAEMMALVEAGKLDQLNLNELLFVAESIAQDNATKNIVLAYAAEKYNDARAYNNLGIVLTEEGRTADALKCFQKAAQLGEASEALNTNLALANLANGNMAEAQKYAKGADAKAKSLVNAAQGNYNDAAKQLDGMNAAIANTMNKDYAAAKRAIAKDMSAEADYLRAVIASEEGDMRTAEAQLKSAVKKDEKMAKKAMKDIHFKKLFEEGLKF